MNRADHIDAQAAEWLIRLDQPQVPTHVRAEFDQWREADPRHEVAYVRLSVGWDRSNRLKAIRPLDTPIDPNILAPPAEEQASQTSWPVRRIAAVAATVLALISVWIVSAVRQDMQAWQTFTADTPEVRGIVLQDGSTVLLNANSKVRVRYTALKRDVQLLRGEANFSVAHDSARPFDVEAGHAVVRAVGTQFTVRRHSAQDVDVVVNEGRVLIDSSAFEDNGITPYVLGKAATSQQRASPEVRKQASLLKAGEIASLRDDELIVRTADKQTLKKENTWMDGRIWFERTMLRDVIAQFNQNNTRQILIADSQIGELKIGGGFALNDPESFVAAAVRTLPVRMDNSDPNVWRLYSAER